MILPLLILLSLAGLALAAAVPVGIAAARQGRQAGWTLAVSAAARAGLAEAESGAWVGAAGLTPLGGVYSLPPWPVRPRLAVTREARRIDGALWLVLARGELADQGGGLLAASEQGLLVRWEVPPGDSIPRLVAAARPWARRPQ